MEPLKAETVSSAGISRLSPVLGTASDDQAQKDLSVTTTPKDQQIVTNSPTLHSVDKSIAKSDIQNSNGAAKSTKWKRRKTNPDIVPASFTSEDSSLPEIHTHTENPSSQKLSEPESKLPTTLKERQSPVSHQISTSSDKAIR